MQSKLLNLGCGDVHLDGFVNVDIQKFDAVDLVRSVYPIIKKDWVEGPTWDLVYSCHVLEHILDKPASVLKSWVENLVKPGGKLRVAVPDFDNIVKIYKKSKNIEMVENLIHGRRDCKWHIHYHIFNERKLKILMESAGLTAIHRWDYRREIHGNMFDMSQAETYSIPISLNLEGRRSV